MGNRTLVSRMEGRDTNHYTRAGYTFVKYESINYHSFNIITYKNGIQINNFSVTFEVALARCNPSRNFCRGS